MHSHKHPIFSYLSILIVSFLLVGNSIIVAYDVSAQLKKDLTNQFYILNYEAGQVVEANSSLLDNLVTSVELQLNNKAQAPYPGTTDLSTESKLQATFTALTQNFHSYNDTLIILTDKKHQILTSVGKTPNPSKDKISLQNRNYLKTLAESMDIQIGAPITGAISKTWRIPIAKAMTNSNKEFIGAIIISIPLAQFSKSIFSSHVNLSSILLETAEQSITTQNNIGSVITPAMVLKTAFRTPFTLLITEPLGNLEQNASFTLNSQSIRILFWNEFMSHSFMATALLAFILLGLHYFTKKVLDPITKIRHQLLESAQVLQTLIPEYRINDFSGPDHLPNPLLQPQHYSDSLEKIESFASSNQLVINTLIKQKNLIEAKDKQLQLLYRNFISAMKSLEEHSKSVSEHIDDIILHNKALKKDEASKMLIKTLEKIYNYSTAHTKRIGDIEETIDTAWESVRDPKVDIDFNYLIQTTCTNKVYLFNTNKDHCITTIPRKKFYLKAINNALMYALSAFEDHHQLEITFNDDAYDISIDIAYNINHIGSISPVDDLALQSAIEKARLFALLDEGVISLYHEQNKIIISIKYFLS